MSLCTYNSCPANSGVYMIATGKRDVTAFRYSGSFRFHMSFIFILIHSNSYIQWDFQDPKLEVPTIYKVPEIPIDLFIHMFFSAFHVPLGPCDTFQVTRAKQKTPFQRRVLGGWDVVEYNMT